MINEHNLKQEMAVEPFNGQITSGRTKLERAHPHTHTRYGQYARADTSYITIYTYVFYYIVQSEILRQICYEERERIILCIFIARARETER